jgi:two-component system sensor histidine kinase MprB
VSRVAGTAGEAVARLDRRWRGLPLRTRLTTAAGLAATLAIVSVVAVAYIAVRHELRAQIDHQLRRQVHELRTSDLANPFTGAHGFTIDTGVGDIGGYAQVVDANGRGVPGSNALPIGARDLRIARTGKGTMLRDIHYDDRHVRMLTTPLHRFPGTALQIGLPLSDVDQQLQRLAVAFAVLAGGGLVLTVLFSWAAVRRVTRPVRTLTDTAEQITTTRDLTLRISLESDDELGRLAAAFNTMLDTLERSLTAQRQLVADASHELRTPLASLRTNVEVLNDVERLSPDQRRAVLAGIVTQLDELTGLVADVVELARGEAPAREHEEVAFDELVARAVERARRHWPTVQFRLETVPVTVRGVPSRLDRAVANMLDNAGKFSPAAATVDVSLDAVGMQATLTVADRGPGVPDDALPHVFDRFYRADEARAMPGSGLGLAIVAQVVEGHGGSIELLNRPNGGAIARLTLPATGSDPVPAPPAPPATVAPAEPGIPVPVEESLFR